MRDRLLFAVVAGSQLFASAGLLWYTFGTSMARFDSGAPATLVQATAEWLFAVLSFPLFPIIERLSTLRVPGVWGYLPFALNASIWGLAAILLRRGIRRS
jgi:hypothetical protein